VIVYLKNVTDVYFRKKKPIEKIFDIHKESKESNSTVIF